MRNGRWWVLLLLSAVFAMHGVQCLDGDGPATSVHAMSLSTWVPGHSTASITAEASDVSPVGVAPMNLAGPDLPASGTLDDAAHSGHPAGSMEHLWAVCLAVLSVGLAVWLAARVARPVTTALRPSRPGRLGRASRARPRRPPDIFALCVLRT
ncbi:hypothetical protein SAMN05661080_04389 [Modestobacter sp. DSM 44400]|uniref:DUF6153 family protein n=1 Tax=Modestobacter sp. DSM 44400 TaxID=1550230 RepID=UPI0008942ADD|nr:DUF6153 family protein [Modestobacter sp. DSM 44400]SDY71870.1 hypothetical protein SAMN05661080_04389 [Modestobacter sp. DSM 44400]